MGGGQEQDLDAKSKCHMCGCCPLQQQVLWKPALASGCHAQLPKAAENCTSVSVNKQDRKLGQAFLPGNKCFLRNKYFFSIEVLHMNRKREMILRLNLVLPSCFQSKGATNYFWPKYLAQTYSTFLKIRHATFWNISFLLNKTSYSVILQKELGFRSHWINNVYPNLMLLH